MSAMTTVGLRNLAAHKVRLALTVISVVLGTAFVAGSFVFTDTLQHSFDTIFNTSSKGIDAQVHPREDGDPGVPVTLLPRLRAVPGVQTVEPDVSRPIVIIDPRGHKIESNGAPSEGGAWTNTSVNPIPTFVSGRAPRRAGEIVVNSGAADQYGLHTGDHVKAVLSGSDVLDVTITGVYRVGYDTGGYLGALFERAQAMRLFTDGRHVDSVDLAARPGVSESTLTARVARVLPSDLEAETGDEVRADELHGVTAGLSFVTYLLLGFGIVALLVGTFIISNTFTMLIAQRQRELALLRAIGASRRQIRRSVLLESGIVGAVGSAIGLGAGLGLALGLHALLDALNLGLPAGGLVVGVRTVVVTLLLGTVVTVLAALTPARRAARIAPVAAMAEFAAPSAAGLRRRTIAGVVVALLAAALTAGGIASRSAGGAAALLGIGLVATCAAALLLSPVLARWLIVPLGRVVGRPFGTIGQLARTNAVRNPRRTAATAFALTLGLVLVSGIAVLGSSIKTSLAGIVDDTVRADYIVTTNDELPVPAPAVTAAQQVPGIASATTLYGLDARFDGHRHFGTAVAGRLSDVAAVPMTAGTLDYGANSIVVSTTTAADEHWTLGSRVRVTAPGATPVTVRVAGLYRDNQLLGPLLTSTALYRHMTPSIDRGAEVVLVHAAAGTDLTQLRRSLQAATNRFYIVTVEDRAGFKGSIAGQVDGLIGLLYGLLGLAIVIAVLGIINTLALSVVERRREIGMLRAVGMQRKQVRRTIYLESLLIAVFGAVLGLSIGMSYGGLFTRALRSAGLGRLSIPWEQNLLFLVLAAAVGVLAALWPGIRAARTPALAAITSG